MPPQDLGTSAILFAQLSGRTHFGAQEREGLGGLREGFIARLDEFRADGDLQMRPVVNVDDLAKDRESFARRRHQVKVRTRFVVQQLIDPRVVFRGQVKIWLPVALEDEDVRPYRKFVQSQTDGDVVSGCLGMARLESLSRLGAKVCELLPLPLLGFTLGDAFLFALIQDGLQTCLHTQTQQFAVSFRETEYGRQGGDTKPLGAA